MTADGANSPRLYVLDTNILMHDPTALFRFEEHGVFIPMIVLEELDAAKKGTSEVARNVRQASRFIDALLGDSDHQRIQAGLDLSRHDLSLENNAGSSPLPSGHLYLQTESLSAALPQALPWDTPDNGILGAVIALRSKYPDYRVVLVSKDINLRIKARVVGIPAEDYYNDRVLDDVNLLYSGAEAVPPGFWAEHERTDDTKQGHGWRIRGPAARGWHPNQFLYEEAGPGWEAVVRSIDGDVATVEPVADYRHAHAVWGVQARNREQSFALNLLMDPNIDFVTLVGIAGTGKTLLALAAGLAQALEQNRYREIIMTRATIPVGEDIGYLPGTEEEKMTPWMGALMDNLEVLTQSDQAGEWGRAATQDLISHRVKIRSLNFMRGRTFLDRYVILDEAQNLTAKQMKTLITRAGPGTKIVCLGNVSQIDTPYLTETSSGLTYVVDHFRHWPHSGHVTLRRGERSRLADFATEQL